MTSRTCKIDRNRSVYLLVTIAVMLLGLISRRYQGILPAFLGKYPGDALWTLMVFFGWGALLSRAPTRRIALLGLGTSYAIEVLKLYQAPWIVSIRHTTLGHLFFGHAFSWQNLIAYVVGAVLGIAFEMIISPLGLKKYSAGVTGEWPYPQACALCDTIPRPKQLFCRNGPSPDAAQYLIYFVRRANNPSGSNWLCHVKLNR
jgi:hypothetical protein